MPVGDAVGRATELLTVPNKDLPELARATRDRMFRRLGGCIEVALTAFAWYAQVCESLPCSDPLYTVDESQPEVVWLRSLACNMPPQPGDGKLVDPASGNGITMGELFGRKKT